MTMEVEGGGGGDHGVGGAIVVMLVSWSSGGNIISPSHRKWGRPKKVIGRGRNKKVLGFTRHRWKKKVFEDIITEDLQLPVFSDATPSFEERRGALIMGCDDSVRTRATNVWRLLPQYLPQELIVEVLSWLSVKDLIRFRCVCKSWNYLIISDATFIKLHLRRSASRNPHLLLQNRNGKVVPFSISRLVENSLTTLPDDPLYALENDRLICQSKVVGSCNRLICFHGYSISPEEYWLCFRNPATRLITEKLGSFHPKGSIINTNFGYDNSTNTFKVVVFEKDYSKERRLQTRVFTLGCNLWRDAQNLPTGVLYCRDQKPNDEVNLRGTLNWLAHQSKAIAVEQFVILSFDLGSEMFTQFPLPLGFDETYPPFIGTLNDYMCLSHVWKKTHYVIWQMKEFGVEKSWTQRFKIRFEDPFSDGFKYQLFPLCFYKGDTLILSSFEHNQEAILCNSRDNRTEIIKMTNVWWSFAGYVESLISPYGK
ncbi:F-box/kelch-repeat protein At3g23880-like [Lotus japonicus]|uniref:F-box/kelch-repeat protein At3g23880-like n=1 Tax=Lotus japonicus TaxID=34305 RepID=UPI00258CBA4A|nr:F-box/kelch-repeat protein At3g23880-like [Lotus japonicus]